MTIQTSGSFDEIENLYSISIAFETHCMTLDGLSRKDLEEIQSCVNCMLHEVGETQLDD